MTVTYSNSTFQISMPSPTLLLRPSALADLPAITAIYAWNVLNGTGTFELETPDVAEMTRRREDVLSKGWPWLVAEIGRASCRERV